MAGRSIGHSPKVNAWDPSMLGPQLGLFRGRQKSKRGTKEAQVCVHMQAAVRFKGKF